MISVCMATFNGARFIREQLDSILPQLNDDDELVISDDGSTDGTLNILQEYADRDSRIRVLRHERKANKYYPMLRLCYSTNNFENVLKNARGDFIFLSDQDDIWEKDKIKEVLELLQNYDFVLHNLSFVDSTGKIIKERHFKKKPFSLHPILDIIHPCFWGCCSCFRREILENVLPIPNKVPQHDTWIGLVAEKIGTCVWINRPLVKHRIYNGNTSFGGKKSENPFSVKIRYRINTLLALRKIKKRNI